MSEQQEPMVQEETNNNSQVVEEKVAGGAEQATETSGQATDQSQKVEAPVESTPTKPDLVYEDLKIFVGGLSEETTVEDLNEYFGKFGQVLYTELKTSAPKKTKAKKYAFVRFSSTDTVAAIMAEPSHVIKALTVDVKQAIVNPNLKMITLKGVDVSVTEENMRAHFEQFGLIEKIEYPNMPIKSEVLIAFSKDVEAEEASKITDQEISGKKFTVHRGKSKPQKKKPDASKAQKSGNRPPNAARNSGGPTRNNPNRKRPFYSQARGGGFNNSHQGPVWRNDGYGYQNYGPAPRNYGGPQNHGPQNYGSGYGSQNFGSFHNQAYGGGYGPQSNAGYGPQSSGPQSRYGPQSSYGAPFNQPQYNDYPRSSAYGQQRRGRGFHPY